mmetsp:Transcript_102977/g.266278  ORF Transcript_102977/g.266278 Transcript_102977/m.266278 type:complete len:236 (+) Transcript_102977:1109-1816(+)
MDSTKMTRIGARFEPVLAARVAASWHLSSTVRRRAFVVFVASRMPTEDVAGGAWRIHSRRLSQHAMASRSLSFFASLFEAEKKSALMPALPSSRRSSPALKVRTRTPSSCRCRRTAPEMYDFPRAGRPTMTSTTASLATALGSTATESAFCTSAFGLRKAASAAPAMDWKLFRPLPESLTSEPLSVVSASRMMLWWRFRWRSGRAPMMVPVLPIFSGTMEDPEAPQICWANAASE